MAKAPEPALLIKLPVAATTKFPDTLLVDTLAPELIVTFALESKETESKKAALPVTLKLPPEEIFPITIFAKPDANLPPAANNPTGK